MFFSSLPRFFFGRKHIERLFSPDDLGLIRIMPCATVGGGMILPSGLVTTDEVIKLTEDYGTNVELVRSIIAR